MEVRGPRARHAGARAAAAPAGDAAGALVLVRDITDLRRRDQALLSKDATIREIHHRVKNNLQTVAALLRLQARRTAIPEARRALAESVRRVNSIALVHESLSGSVAELVDLDELVDTVLPGDRRRRDRGVAGQGAPRRQLRHPARRAGDARWCWCSPSSCTTRWRTLSTPGTTGEVVRARHPVARPASTWWWPTTERACRPASIRSTPSGLGLQIVRTLLELGTGLVAAVCAPASEAGRRPSSASR